MKQEGENKLIVVGYNSMIASQFLEKTSQTSILGIDKDPANDSVNINRLQLNVLSTSKDEIVKKLEKKRGGVIINFVAQTNVDGAEAEGDKDNLEGVTYLLNVALVKKLVDVANELDLKLVHFSTDFIFDGKDGPYSEDSMPAKNRQDIGWYGWTKKLAEEQVKNADNYLIIRTAYPYRARIYGKHDFVSNLLEKLENNDLYEMFDNQYLTPTFIDNLVKALDLLIEKNQSGVWNVVDNTTLSAFQAARTIAKVFGFDPSAVKSGDLIEWQKANPDKAKRPANGGLLNQKLNAFLDKSNFQMKDFPQSLLELKRQLALMKEKIK